MPVAMARNGTLYFVHADHLGTPQKVTDASQNLAWDAVLRPFGRIEQESFTFTQLLRFPGQYHDTEDKLFYNGFRDYDPDTGRYTESDPIGLEGGPNTYSYVGGNPITRIDPWGTDWLDRLTCFANCVERYDVLGVGGDIALTGAGGTFPKAWAGLPQGLGGASPVTTIPSALGGKGLPRRLGRIASPLWLAYGNYLLVMEIYCAVRAW